MRRCERQEETDRHQAPYQTPSDLYCVINGEHICFQGLIKEYFSYFLNGYLLVSIILIRVKVKPRPFGVRFPAWAPFILVWSNIFQLFRAFACKKKNYAILLQKYGREPPRACAGCRL
jgi:hypothetical protein